ncbi:crotonase/enoyl-CoA hydratase family protein [Hoyosella rhizosphaerae]|nr:crotonase/enoyl-CoA hydratase family protein [Hoyosella rhizosphaerae]MBN4927883.1 crotonase/enoyl-CoA hydratase family protein [Hoyosella rhizosphaerae]
MKIRTFVSLAPSTARALVQSILSTTQRGDSQSGSSHHAEPTMTFEREFSHLFAESTDVTATPETVMTHVLDFANYGDWFTLHSGWPSPPPSSLSVGDTFEQNARIMGTPVRLSWTVTTLTDFSLAIEGTGPMGAHAAIGITATPHNSSGTTVTVTNGFHSDALKGPMGAIVSRAMRTATVESLANFRTVLGDTEDASALPARPKPTIPPKPEPVLHLPSGTTIDPWTPVIVGVGQVTHNPDDGSRDPMELAVSAAQRALDDATHPTLPAQRTRVSTVPSTSWSYGDHQSAILANELNIVSPDLAQSAPLGGDGPLRLVNNAADAITHGEIDFAVISGAEAFASLSRHGTNDTWNRDTTTPFAPLRLGSDRSGNNHAEEETGLLTPTVMYGLMDTALRGRLGHTIADHREKITRLWAGFSTVAANNPYAWIREQLSADDIGKPTESNRPIATPYTKLMTANITVDQGAAVVIASAAAAHEAGIPQEQWVFVHAGAYADEEWFVSERHTLGEVPAIGAIGDALTQHLGAPVSDADHIDLYSCFPFAVYAAARELNLPLDDPKKPLTCTGGLTFAGGPLNNYATHGLASVTAAVRNNPGSTGLATALGWYATKHAATVVSTNPPRQQFRDLNVGTRMQRPAARSVTATHTGSATVETYTVTYSPDGAPEAVIFSALLEDGTRWISRSTDSELIAQALETDLIGATLDNRGALTVEGGNQPDRVNTIIDSTVKDPLLKVQWEGPLCILTLNRPEVRNAINLELALALERAIDDFEADSEAIVAILTGVGQDFCTGMDLKAAAQGQYPIAPSRGLLGITGRPPQKPIIAAVEGNALAGGCEIALACDLIVAAKDATFGLPEPKRGLVAAAGGVLRLAQRLPRPIALEMALTGEPIAAPRVHQLGLINAVARPGTALKVARELAGKIAPNAPLSLQLSKQIVDEWHDWPTNEAYGRQSDIASEASFSADAQEGIAAFDEKRTPNWTGR